MYAVRQVAMFVITWYLSSSRQMIYQHNVGKCTPLCVVQQALKFIVVVYVNGVYSAKVKYVYIPYKIGCAVESALVYATSIQHLCSKYNTVVPRLSELVGPLCAQIIKRFG